MIRQDARALLDLGLVDLVENKPDAREHILASLIGAAGLVLQEGNPLFAARLLRAVESVFKVLDAVMDSSDKQL